MSRKERPDDHDVCDGCDKIIHLDNLTGNAEDGYTCNDCKEELLRWERRMFADEYDDDYERRMMAQWREADDLMVAAAMEDQGEYDELYGYSYDVPQETDMEFLDSLYGPW